LIAAIRNNEKYNEVERGCMASVVTSMGRMAAHTGQEITLEQMMNCEHEFAPDIDKLTLESESPLSGRRRRQVPNPTARSREDSGIRITARPRKIIPGLCQFCGART
jgi:hypothetical protein